MKKYILIITIFYLIGCSTSVQKKNNDNKLFYVRDINSQLLQNFYIIILEDLNTNKIKFLLSSRLGKKVDKPPFEKYEIIQKYKDYELSLILQDSIYVLRENAIISHRGNYKFFLEDVLFLSNDTIKTKIYRTEDMFDNFVKLR